MKKNIFEEAMLEIVLFGFDVITSSGTNPVNPFSDESELNTTGHDNDDVWVNP
jgi:hypothetical protein